MKTMIVGFLICIFSTAVIAADEGEKKVKFVKSTKGAILLKVCDTSTCRRVAFRLEVDGQALPDIKVEGKAEDHSIKLSDKEFSASAKGELLYNGKKVKLKVTSPSMKKTFDEIKMNFKGDSGVEFDFNHEDQDSELKKLTKLLDEVNGQQVNSGKFHNGLRGGEVESVYDSMYVDSSDQDNISIQAAGALSV